MMSHPRWIYASLVLLTPLAAQADIPGPGKTYPQQMAPGYPNQGGGAQKVVYKRQREIDEYMTEISVEKDGMAQEKDELVVIKETIREIDVSDRDDEYCDCSGKGSSCGPELMRLNASSCEDIYEAVKGNFSRIESSCRREVRRCTKISRKHAKKEQKDRERELAKTLRERQARIRKLEREIKKLQEEGNTTIVVQTNANCSDCDRGPSTTAILGSSLINVGGQIAMGAIGLRANKQYYKAYSGAMNRHYDYNQNAMSQYYGQIPGVLDHYNNLGIPYNYQQYQGGTMGYPPPVPMGGGIFGAALNPGLAMGMGLGMGVGMGGSPFGYGMGGGGMMNPYGGMGMDPYGLGMGAGYPPYMNGMGMGAPGSPWGGMNLWGNLGAGGMGYPGYAGGMIYPGAGGMNGGWMNGGLNGGWGGGNSQYLLQGQYAQMQQQNAMIAQQQMMEAQYRYQQVQMQGQGNWGLGFNPYGSGNLGVGLNFGLGVGGNLNFGAQPTYFGM